MNESRGSRARLFGLAAVTALFWPRPGQAQDAHGGLTSEGAVELAVKHNPSLHVALLQQEQARYAVRAEEALYDPLFNASGTLVHNRTPSLRGADGTLVTTSDIVNLGAGLSKTFPVG